VIVTLRLRSVMASILAASRISGSALARPRPCLVRRNACMSNRGTVRQQRAYTQISFLMQCCGQRASSTEHEVTASAEVRAHCRAAPSQGILKQVGSRGSLVVTFAYDCKGGAGRPGVEVYSEEKASNMLRSPIASVNGNAWVDVAALVETEFALL